MLCISVSPSLSLAPTDRKSVSLFDAVFVDFAEPVEKLGQIVGGDFSRQIADVNPSYVANHNVPVAHGRREGGREGIMVTLSAGV